MEHESSTSSQPGPQPRAVIGSAIFANVEGAQTLGGRR